MEFLTCLNGHRNAADKWKRSEIDPACLLCPACSEVVDSEKPTRRRVEAVAPAIPIGRRAGEVLSLIAKLKLWVENRDRLRLDCKDLKASIKYLEEYSSALVDGDPDLACGAALDRLADPTPRNEGETDADFRKRVFGNYHGTLYFNGEPVPDIRHVFIVESKHHGSK